MITLIVQALMVLTPIAIWVVIPAPADIPCDRVTRTYQFPDQLNAGV